MSFARAAAGSPVQKSEDRYYCRACFCSDFADVIAVTDSITCAECDSDDVILLAQYQRETLAKREAMLAAADRESDARSSLAVFL